MGKFDNGIDSEDDDLREDVDATTVAPEQPKASVAIDLVPHLASGSIAGGSSSRFMSPPLKIVIKRKGKKRSSDLSIIPKSILAKVGAATLSNDFQAVVEEQEEET